MNNYMIIDRNNYGAWIIRAEHNGNEYSRIQYYGTSKRSAIKAYRNDNGLQGKRFTIIDMTRG